MRACLQRACLQRLPSPRLPSAARLPSACLPSSDARLPSARLPSTAAFNTPAFSGAPAFSVPAFNGEFRRPSAGGRERPCEVAVWSESGRLLPPISLNGEILLRQYTRRNGTRSLAHGVV